MPVPGLLQNTASQNLTFCLVNATTGAGLTGATVTTKVALDGTQSPGGGTVTELGSGQYKYVPTQAETNGTTVGFLFTATNAVPVNLHCFITSAVLPANVTQIDGLATNGNNATLNLLKLNIVNSGGDAIVASSTGSNGSGINASGNGSGHGVLATGGATGSGMKAVGGATSGNGLYALATTAGNGIRADGVGANGGIAVTAGATGHGLDLNGGASSGSGLRIRSTSGDGVLIQPTSGHGISTTGDGASKHGINAAAGGSGGSGIAAAGNVAGSGITATGGTTGHGLETIGGATSGNGIKATGTNGNSAAMNLVGQGSAAGLLTTGGATGAGVSAVGQGGGRAILAANSDIFQMTDGVETGLTPLQEMRLTASASAGKLSGAATTTVVIRNAVADSKDRITATVDTDGNRTAVTTDVT